MKIAFVLTQSLECPSGLGRYGPIAREMVRLGHQVEVIALHYAWDKLAQKRFYESGVRVNYAGQMHIRKEGSRKLYFSPGRLLMVSLAATLRLARALAWSDAEVIHLGKPQPFNVLAARLARHGRPLYCDCDDYEAATNRFSNAWQRRIVSHFEDDIIHHVSGLTVNTHFTRLRYQQLGFPANRITYVPNGVDRKRFSVITNLTELREKWRLDVDTPLIVYVGTLGLTSHPVDLLLQAFAKIRSKLPAVRLLLIGGGEDRDLLIKQAKELGLGDQVIFTGRVPPHEVPGYLALATVSVDPVYDNPVARARSPLKIFESLAMGVPVVTGDVGDRASFLGEEHLGRIVRPGDCQALSEGILMYLEKPERHWSTYPIAHHQQKEWYWDYLVHSFLQVYNY
jgi:glycosyltransferase involved in cell wall biosynthesis